MSLLGFDDVAGSSTGNGYLDIVDFILHGWQNLRELYRRVAFYIMYGNTDGHFRNHGFLLTPKGWTLSPAYDINPGAKSHQYLLIDSYTEESDINILLSASVSYMLAPKKRLRLLRMFMPHQSLAQNCYRTTNIPQTIRIILNPMGQII